MINMLMHYLNIHFFVISGEYYIPTLLIQNGQPGNEHKLGQLVSKTHNEHKLGQMVSKTHNEHKLG